MFYDLSFCLNSIIICDKHKDLLREKGLKFHIESNDYFGTLATILDLMKQKRIKNKEEDKETLGRIKNDLVYLQENYRIVEKK